MGIGKKLLTLVTAASFGVSLACANPKEAQAMPSTSDISVALNYLSLKHEVNSYIKTMESVRKGSETWKAYDKNYDTNVFRKKSLEKNIALAEERISYYDAYKKEINENKSLTEEQKAEKLKEVDKRKNEATKDKEKFQKELHEDRPNKGKIAKDVAKQYGKAANQVLVEFLNYTKDPEHFDKGGATLRIAAKFASCALDTWGLGCLADTWMSWLQGQGGGTQSETDALLNDIEGLFDDVHKELGAIEKDIAELSKKIDKQTETIISQLTNAIEATSSKERVMEFTSSASGNFSYNRFKNYVLGTSTASDNPTGFKEAYATKLNDLIYENAPAEDIKAMYDRLYVALDVGTDNRKSNIDVFYEDYLLENKSTYTQSIIRDFYTYLAANEDLLVGKSPEVIAYDFLSDLYQTACAADEKLCSCYQYQILYMMIEKGSTELDDNDKYYYGSGDNDYVTYGDIIQSYDAIYSREARLEEQFAKDLSYILSVGESYYRDIEDVGIQYYTNNNTETFGQVMTGDTIYLNEFDDNTYAIFDLYKSQITYAWYAGDKNVTVDPYASYLYVDDFSKDNENYNNTLTVVAYYDDTELYSIEFLVDNDESFSGGTGTFEDPYLISSPNQFLAISNEENMDKCFKLINDLDFTNIKYTSIGNQEEQFDGILDGNGHTISGVYGYSLTDEAVGLFGYLGANAIVKNLKMSNCSFIVSVSGKSAAYAGAIAGCSSGLIYNCDVVGTSVKTELKNKPENNNTINHAVYAYAGGIVGITFSSSSTQSDFDQNSCQASNFFQVLDTYQYAMNESGNIYYCTFNEENDKGFVTASTNRDYAGNGDAANQSFSYAGGIAGYVSKKAQIGNCAVMTNGELLSINAVVDSYSDKIGTSYIYASSYAGGIAGFAENSANLVNIYSGFEADESGNCVKGVSASYDVFNWGGMWILGFDLSLDKKECKAFAKKYCSGVQIINEMDHFSREKYPTAKNNKYDVEYIFTDDYDTELAKFKEDMLNDFGIDVSEKFAVRSNYKVSQYIIDVNDALELDKLEFIVNGKKYVSESASGENKYKLLNYHYTKDFTNIDFDNDTEISTIVLFSIDVDGKTVILSKEIPMVILSAYIESISIEQYPSISSFEYIGKYKFDGKIAINYSNGLRKIVDFSVNDNDSLKELFSFKQLSSNGNDSICKDINFGKTIQEQGLELGLSTIVISYEGLEVRYNVKINCSHSNSDRITSGRVYSTCTHEGYDYEYCRDCNQIISKTNIQPKMEHFAGDPQNVVDATCTHDGYSGDIYCTVCGCLLEKGTVTPKLAHTFIEFDEHTHICINENNPEGDCTAREEHQFIVIENVDSIVYKCVTCGYESEPIPKSRSEIESLPKIVVSDGYVLEGGKQVEVYVSIVNNPGITGASFSIVFDENLKYITYENGSIIVSPVCFVNDKDALSNHIVSFTVASDAASYKNGTLIKLVFETPSECNVGDKFDVQVTYSNSKKGMFSSPTNKAFDVLTFAGSVNVVDHLPGDVNNDNVVNLIDAVAIARYLSKDENFIATSNIEQSQTTLDGKYYFYSCYSDLNLDGGTNIDDLTRLLQYIVGGYDSPVQANDYSITLKKNGGKEGSEKDENKTYEEIINMSYYAKDSEGNYIYNESDREYERSIMKLPELYIEGYTFDGWYTEFIGGTKVETGDLAYFDADKYKQTLYAHFTQNKITLVIDDVTDVLYYVEGRDVNTYNILDYAEKYSKDATIKFYYGYDNPAKLIYEKPATKGIIGWKTIDGVEITNYDYDFVYGDFGNLVLYPIWNEISIPKKGSVEYEAIKVELNNIDPNAGIMGWSLVHLGQNFKGSISSSTSLFLLASEKEYFLTYDANYDGLHYQSVTINNKTYNSSDIRHINSSDITTYKETDARKTGTDYEKQLEDMSSIFTLEGHTLRGWVDENGKVYKLDEVISTEVAGNTLYAVWGRNSYNVQFVEIDKRVSKNVKYYETITYAPNYEDINRKLSCWYIDEKFESKYENAPIVDDITLYGKFERIYDTLQNSRSLSVTLTPGTYKVSITSKYEYVGFSGYYEFSPAGSVQAKSYIEVRAGGFINVPSNNVSSCSVKYSFTYYGPEGNEPSLSFSKVETKTSSGTMSVERDAKYKVTCSNPDFELKSFSGTISFTLEHGGTQTRYISLDSDGCFIVDVSVSSSYILSYSYTVFGPIGSSVTLNIDKV